MMRNRIKTFYLIHHSHTDIGYTDLQEQVVYNHINNIRQAVSIIRYGIDTTRRKRILSGTARHITV